MLSVVIVINCRHQQPKIVIVVDKHLLLEFSLAVWVVDYAQPIFWKYSNTSVIVIL